MSYYVTPFHAAEAANKSPFKYTVFKSEIIELPDE